MILEEPHSPPRMILSQTSTSSKRHFNQEEEDNEEIEKGSMRENKKMKKNKFYGCLANRSPRLLKKFLYSKNKTWGSTWKNYFVTFFKNMNKTDKTKISDQTLPLIYKEKVVAMKGLDPIFIIQKNLFKSDLTRQANRFSIPHRQMENEFLNDEEKDELKHHQPLEVTLIDPSRREWTLNLNLWNMNTDAYVLISPNWYKLVEVNKLEEGMKVQLWSFRVDERLCFILVRL